MVRHNTKGRGGGKNAISNVRIVDKDDGTDDIQCQRYLQAYKVSEGQIRVVCNARIEVPLNTTASSGVLDYNSLGATDEFASFAAQYREFRVRAIRFDVYDLAPTVLTPINFWATFHNIAGNVPQSFEDVVDRPDSRAISPGTGMTTLAWVAHGIPEMAFQPTVGYQNLGGLVNYIGGAAAAFGGKYSLIGKFVVDFRGRY